MADAYEVVLRNVATGGRVSRVAPFTWTYKPDARRYADERNRREGRAGCNVFWTVRQAAALQPWRGSADVRKVERG